MRESIRVFFNPRSGRPGFGEGRAGERRQAQELAALFAGQGLQAEITRLTARVDLAALAAADPEDTAYIAAGGDGTVNAIANTVVGSNRPMGVLPVGTLNHFARDLQLPLELEDAIGPIADGHIRRVDAAEVNGRIFVNNSSLGAYPAMVMDRERMKKSGRNKWASLAAASFRAFVRFRCLTVEMKVAGEQRVCTTPFLFVGNNEYCVEGAQLGRRERLDRGILSLYLAPGASRLGVLRMAFAAVLGRLKQTTEYQELQVTDFTVHVRGNHRLRVSMDGEVVRMRGPLRYRILPGALTVLAPDPSETAPAS